MDEARLKEIEEMYGVESPIRRTSSGIVIKELIAALRDAWRERDELVAHVQRLTPVNEIVERADRAEAEVQKLREQAEIERRESVDLHIRLNNALEKLKSLRAVRECADIFVKSAFVGAYDDSNAGLVRKMHRIEFDRLCRALDSTKDSTR